MSLLPSVTFIWQFKFFHKFLCLFYLWTVKYKYSKLQLFTGSSLFWFVSYWCISKLMWTSVDNGHTLKVQQSAQIGLFVHYAGAWRYLQILCGCKIVIVGVSKKKGCTQLFVYSSIGMFIIWHFFVWLRSLAWSSCLWQFWCTSTNPWHQALLSMHLLFQSMLHFCTHSFKEQSTVR